MNKNYTTVLLQILVSLKQQEKLFVLTVAMARPISFCHFLFAHYFLTLENYSGYE